ncbi:hypothetical protein [Lebetimonas sp. JS170]|uniref:hypothetical protein n=2 Tax=unclassified Lebetimonas TaxID=2648158 RepID=UPI000467DC61|nr:hypothetical protein [Lebetimonas sp. JS170]
MYFWIYGMHIIFFFSYGVFFLQFIKSLQNDLKDKFFFGVLSLVFMLLVLFDGTKLILLNPAAAKTGVWLHVKLTFFIAVMIENIILFYFLIKKKKFTYNSYNILYWINYFVFIIMIVLAVFKFF